MTIKTVVLVKHAAKSSLVFEVLFIYSCCTNHEEEDILYQSLKNVKSSDAKVAD